jgi:hypothetical protein
MPGAADLIQTIVSLRRLQQADEAAQLAREQFGLQQQEFGFQRDTTQENLLGQVQELAGKVADKQALYNLVPFMARRTGADESQIRDLIKASPTSEATTKAQVVQRGVAKLGESLDTQAGAVATTGQTLGGLGNDQVQTLLSNAARNWYSTQTPAQQAAIDSEIGTRRLLGTTKAELINDQMYASLPPTLQRQATLIGAQLMPGANQDQQNRLGVAQLQLQRDNFLSESAAREVQLRIAAEEAKSKLDKSRQTAFQEVMKNLSDFETSEVKNASSLTPAGQYRYNATINAYYEQLRHIAPEIFGQKDPVTGQIIGGTIRVPDLPLTGQGLGATGMFNPNYFQK